jgi:hypothetical protein
VSIFFCLSFVDLIRLGSAPNFCFFVFGFQACGRSWELGDPGTGCPDGI